MEIPKQFNFEERGVPKWAWDLFMKPETVSRFLKDGVVMFYVPEPIIFSRTLSRAIEVLKKAKEVDSGGRLKDKDTRIFTFERKTEQWIEEFIEYA